METFIIKRDGSREPFSIDKIKNAIAKAFLSVGSFATGDVMTNILSRVIVTNDTTVEDIQNQVEVALMAERYYAVAKAFMLYRQRHSEDREVRDKLKFLIEYCNSSGATSGESGSRGTHSENNDTAAAVIQNTVAMKTKNMTTLLGELPKSFFIRLNRRMLTDRIKEMYGRELSDRYLELLNDKFIFKNDETPLINFSAGISMYPWLVGGTMSIGGNSKAPSDLHSFASGFVNMLFTVSSMLSGPCATPEFLIYMNYFIGLEYGGDYYKHGNRVVDLSQRRRTLDKVITDYFQQIVHSVNQPAGTRNFQPANWHISYYDSYSFDRLFGNFMFPDGTRPDWDSFSWLQKRFMEWLNQERVCAMLGYPAETMVLLTEHGAPKDKEYADFSAEMYAAGHSFHIRLIDNTDWPNNSCSRNENSETPNHSPRQANGIVPPNNYSGQVNGACAPSSDCLDRENNAAKGLGPVPPAFMWAGSKSVLTIDLNRCIQYAASRGMDYQFLLEETVDLAHKVQIACNENLKHIQSKGMFPLFDAGYIDMDRQYLTIRVNGLIKAAEFLGIDISDNSVCRQFIAQVLDTVEKHHKKYSGSGLMFNCEFILAGEASTTEGPALHINIDGHPDKAQYVRLIEAAAHEGCNYFTFDIANTTPDERDQIVCDECDETYKSGVSAIPKCESDGHDHTLAY